MSNRVVPSDAGLCYARAVMKGHVLRLVLATWLSLLVTSVGADARAGDKASAEALFQEGKELMDADRLDEACPKFQASFEADPAIGALLNLALCHQRQGKTASAWAEFTEAAAMARRSGDSARERGAEGHARALEPSLSRLTISATEPTDGLRITRNGIAMVEGSLGTALPVDPGEHEIEATAPGHRRWSTTVTVAAEGDRQSVSIPALEPLPEGASDEGADAGGGPGTQAVAGWVLTGVGAASVVVGAILGGIASSEISDARNDDNLCPDDICTPDGREQVDAAEGLAHGSTALFVIGGAFAVAGVVLLVTAESDDAPADEAAMLVPVVGPSSAGLTLSGRF